MIWFICQCTLLLKFCLFFVLIHNVRQAKRTELFFACRIAVGLRTKCSRKQSSFGKTGIRSRKRAAGVQMSVRIKHRYTILKGDVRKRSVRDG